MMKNHSADYHEQEDGLDIKRYLQLVLERKRLFIAIALTVMFLAIIVAYVIPKKYNSESVVFIEQNVISDLVKGIAITPSMDMKIKAIKVTMLSRSMLTKMIRELDLDLGMETQAQMDNLIKSYQNNVNIRLDEKRGVITISYTDKNPFVARDVVNTLTRLYIEENTSTKRQESFEATKFLAEQIEVFKDRIDAAEAEIDAFKTESGKMLSADEGAVRRKIERAEDELAQVNIKINALKTSRSILLQNTPLRNQLEEQEKSLKLLRTKYTESHPQVVQLKNSIAQTKAQLRSGGSGDLSSVYRSEEYQGVKVELESLESIKNRLEEEIDRENEILKQIPTLRTQLAELERKKMNEVIIYEKLVSRYGQSEVSKEMELQDKSMSFRVLDPAVVASSPSSPNRPLIIGGSMVLGIGLAIGLIILLDLINPTINTVDDLRKFGLPVLAVIPKIKDVEAEREQRRINMRVYAIGAFGLFVVLSFLVIEVLHLGIVDQLIQIIRYSVIS